MKIIQVMIKSLKEQIRNFWILLLTVSMAPFFVFVYFLIIESSKPHYDLFILNLDQGTSYSSPKTKYGNLLIEYIETRQKKFNEVPLRIKNIENRAQAMGYLKNKKGDALIVLPEDFSARIQKIIQSKNIESIPMEIVGDLTNSNYMISAIWANEFISSFLFDTTKTPKLLKVRETGLGISEKINDFDLAVPGILILSIIMLMFSSSIAIITEVENNTIIRLKLSKISTFEFLAGTSIVQILIGIISILLTLFTASALGFNYYSSFYLFMLIALLSSLSIIAFSLILAALTKTVNEVLIVGNFPLFLFMFFTGAAFPMKGKELLSIAGYPLTIQGLMSATHSISALNKVFIMNMGLGEILPEISAILILTAIYFSIGIWAFQRRHMKIL